MKQNCLLYMELGKNKRNFHLVMKQKGDIDKDKILYFMPFLQSSSFEPKLSTTEWEIQMLLTGNFLSRFTQAQSSRLNSQDHEFSCHSKLQTIFILRQTKILYPLCYFNLLFWPSIRSKVKGEWSGLLIGAIILNYRDA